MCKIINLLDQVIPDKFVIFLTNVPLFSRSHRFSLNSADQGLFLASSGPQFAPLHVWKRVYWNECLTIE